MNNPKKILILFAHPALEKSQVNKPLIQALVDIKHVTIHDLYEIYPDFYIDIPHEQQLLREHDILVFQHPLYWYSSPALLKEWQDLVLTYGFAYGEENALQGKTLLNVITTGGIQEAYQHGGVNHFTIREILTPFIQTARFCGMAYLPPFVVHGARLQETRTHVLQLTRDYRTVISALRDNRLDVQQIQQFEYLNQCLELLKE